MGAFVKSAADEVLPSPTQLVEVQASASNLARFKSKYGEMGDDAVKSIFDRFNKQQQRLEIKDIFGYKTLDALNKEVESKEASLSGKQQAKLIKQEGADVVLDNDTILVVRPRTHEASCYYGAGTKWCTAAEDPYYWRKYRREGKTVFYLFPKKTSEKFGISLLPDGTMEAFAADDADENPAGVLKEYGVDPKLLLQYKRPRSSDVDPEEDEDDDQSFLDVWEELLPNPLTESPDRATLPDGEFVRSEADNSVAFGVLSSEFNGEPEDRLVVKPKAIHRDFLTSNQIMRWVDSMGEEYPFVIRGRYWLHDGNYYLSFWENVSKVKANWHWVEQLMAEQKIPLDRAYVQYMNMRDEDWKPLITPVAESKAVDLSKYKDCTGMGLSGSIAASFACIRRKGKTWCPAAKFEKLKKLMKSIKADLKESSSDLIDQIANEVFRLNASHLENQEDEFAVVITKKGRKLASYKPEVGIGQEITVDLEKYPGKPVAVVHTHPDGSAEATSGDDVFGEAAAKVYGYFRIYTMGMTEDGGTTMTMAEYGETPKWMGESCLQESAWKDEEYAGTEDTGCDLYAQRLVKEKGGKVVWIDELHGADQTEFFVDHCVALIDGKYYDKLNPKGVKDWRDLKYVRAVGRGYYPAAVYRNAWNRMRGNVQESLVESKTLMEDPDTAYIPQGTGEIDLRKPPEDDIVLNFDDENAICFGVIKPLYNRSGEPTLAWGRRMFHYDFLKGDAAREFYNNPVRTKYFEVSGRVWLMEDGSSYCTFWDREASVRSNWKWVESFYESIHRDIKKTMFQTVEMDDADWKTYGEMTGTTNESARTLRVSEADELLESPDNATVRYGYEKDEVIYLDCEDEDAISFGLLSPEGADEPKPKLVWKGGGIGHMSMVSAKWKEKYYKERDWMGLPKDERGEKPQPQAAAYLTRGRVWIVEGTPFLSMWETKYQVKPYWNDLILKFMAEANIDPKKTYYQFIDMPSNEWLSYDELWKQPALPVSDA